MAFIKRTNAEKRQSVVEALADPNNSNKGDTTIAALCGVTRMTVYRVRNKVTQVSHSQKLRGEIEKLKAEINHLKQERDDALAKLDATTQQPKVSSEKKPRRRYGWLSPETRAEIISYYFEQGKSGGEIAKILGDRSGASNPSIYKVIKIERDRRKAEPAEHR